MRVITTCSHERPSDAFASESLFGINISRPLYAVSLLGDSGRYLISGHLSKQFLKSSKQNGHLGEQPHRYLLSAEVSYQQFLVACPVAGIRIYHASRIHLCDIPSLVLEQI